MNFDLNASVKMLALFQNWKRQLLIKKNDVFGNLWRRIEQEEFGCMVLFKRIVLIQRFKHKPLSYFIAD